MSSSTRLFDVEYNDLTRYGQELGNDVVGCPIFHYWGPLKEVKKLNNEDFLKLFPDVAPHGITKPVTGSLFYAYAQIKKAYEGTEYCEVFRMGNWKYQYLKVSGSTMTLVSSENPINEEFSDDSARIGLKYAGFLPNVAPYSSFARIGIAASVENGEGVYDGKVVMKVALKGVRKDGTESVIESYIGGVMPGDTLAGEPFFIENVIKEKSDVLDIKVNLSKIPGVGASTSGTLLFEVYSEDEDVYPEDTEIEEAILKFEEILTSDATVIISPEGTNKFDAQIRSVATKKKTACSVVGYPIADVFTKDNILTAYQLLAKEGGPSMSIFVAGRESLSVFGQAIVSNCIGGFCARTSSTAKQVRVNQPASGLSFGAYGGALTASLSFEEVLDLHEEGVCSIFNSTSGPRIWGVRAISEKSQSASYWSKWNVNRVLVDIFRRVFPECLNAVHTDAAANPITRSQYQGVFNAIITDSISTQNLQADSYADCGARVNSDVNTKGGEIFNLLLDLHFIKVVEHVKIRVFATDSSVDAEIINSLS